MLLMHANGTAGMHRHFILFGLMDHLERRSVTSCSIIFELVCVCQKQTKTKNQPSYHFVPKCHQWFYFSGYRLNQHFSPDEVLQLLDSFFNLELLVRVSFQLQKWPCLPWSEVACDLPWYSAEVGGVILSNPCLPFLEFQGDLLLNGLDVVQNEE